MPFQFDKEKTKKKLSLMFEKFKTEADIQLVNEYRALFKKEVPFSRRSWMAAYLLMLLDQGQGNAGRLDWNRDRYTDQGRRNFEERAPANAENGNSRKSRPSLRTESQNETNREPPRPSLPEEESRRLFISIGRNRRVFPREILGLITVKAEISRDDIGAIRIMDNYSFVQVRDSVADDIIEALNGQPFRGRTLTVNYARARKEDSDQSSLEDESSPLNETDSAAADFAEDSFAVDTAGDGAPADSLDNEEDSIEEAAEDSLDHEDDQSDEEGV
ncbi:RNA-binding protein [Spirochaetia bacterium]|nr:RNA-binding protein [Spirochaetia bacterium]